MLKGRTSVVVGLGTAQTLAWASTYYLPAMLAVPMARDLGIATPTVYAAFSVALLVSAVLGPAAGAAIDRWDGKRVLPLTNLVFAAGLALLGVSHSGVALFAAWAVLGIGMASGLYEAAFAALVRLYGQDARGAITGITLLAGFASTVGWPLSAWMEAHYGWRGACFGWAGLHLVLGFPLNLLLPKAGPATPESGEAVIFDPASPGAADASLRIALLLSVVFAVTWFISTAMAAHLPRLLMAGGATMAGAVAIGALVGPAQVAGRLLEFGVLRKASPLLSARLAALMHPLGAVVLIAFGAPVAALFALMHGAGNGILTIAKGTLPLVHFGPDGYGKRQGILMVPARIAQALAPWLFGVWLDRYGAGALWFSAGFGVLAFAALMALPRSDRQTTKMRP